MKILLFLLLTLPVYSQVDVKYDKFKDQTTATSDTYLSKGLQMYVKAMHRGEKSEDIQYFLVFRDSGKDWQYLRSHGLIFLADGSRMDLGTGAHDGKINTSRFGSSVSEVMMYRIVRADLEKLANSSLVEMKLGRTELVFGEKDKKAVKEMLDYK